MAGRPLTPDERALWARVLVSVRPMHKRAAAITAAPMPKAASVPSPVKRPGPRPDVPVALSIKPKPRPLDRATLDGSWNRQLVRGAVYPDRTIDLHGHNLQSAYGLLDHALEQAIRAGDRVILLVTGKPPRPESERPHARGAIRAAVGDWLAGSRHAAAIAAVRGAHPRHGGLGALYIVLRRTRDAVP